MKQLMIRNLKLRSWTLILYALLLLFFPIYHLLNKDTPLYSIISGPIINTDDDMFDRYRSFI